MLITVVHYTELPGGPAKWLKGHFHLNCLSTIISQNHDGVTREFAFSVSTLNNYYLPQVTLQIVMCLDLHILSLLPLCYLHISVTYLVAFSPKYTTHISSLLSATRATTVQCSYSVKLPLFCEHCFRVLAEGPLGISHCSLFLSNSYVHKFSFSLPIH